MTFLYLININIFPQTENCLLKFVNWVNNVFRRCFTFCGFISIFPLVVSLLSLLPETSTLRSILKIEVLRVLHQIEPRVRSCLWQCFILKLVFVRLNVSKSVHGPWQYLWTISIRVSVLLRGYFYYDNNKNPPFDLFIPGLSIQWMGHTVSIYRSRF